MNAALWIAQVLTAVLFAISGVMKATWSLPDLVQNGVDWADDLPFAMVRFIGFCELVGAASVLLPALTGIGVRLVAVAASCFVLLMILATLFHLSRGEFGGMPITLALGALAGFVAWGRSGRHVPPGTRPR
jgi:hypothetical protein